MTGTARGAPLVVASLAVVVAGALALAVMGHPWICPCGTVKLWGAQGVAGENSQHLLDWYAPSHIVHGLLFYALAWALLRRFSHGLRFLAALLVEVAWEVVEGTPMLIDRYRGATVSLDYFGDSVLNSVVDVVLMIGGYWLAKRLPVSASVLLVVAIEVAAGIAIRDNLVLNMLMLLWPIAAIKEWQAGA